MTPAARLQAAIDILDTLASTSKPADGVLKAWGKANRYAGSGDRRAVAENVYAALRTGGQGTGRQRMIVSLRAEGLAPEAITAMFEGGRFGPAPLTKAELASLSGDSAPVLADFLQAQFEASFGPDWAEEARALLGGRATLDVRVNTAKAAVEQVQRFIGGAPTPFSALGLRIGGHPDLIVNTAFEAGEFEVQDEGSQIVAFLAGEGEVIVDYCAGGGGKTLALAMLNPSRLVACDVDRRRLDAIKPRLARAGVEADLRKIGPNGGGAEDLNGLADLVLVDAPCSASGTWRRRPEAASRLTQADLESLNRIQTGILARAALLVKPGGRLAYVTCSVLDIENGAVAGAFARSHPGFRPVAIDQAATTGRLTDAARARLAELSAGGHTVQLSPRRTATDGFFIALFERSL